MLYILCVVHPLCCTSFVFEFSDGWQIKIVTRGPYITGVSDGQVDTDAIAAGMVMEAEASMVEPPMVPLPTHEGKNKIQCT